MMHATRSDLHHVILSFQYSCNNVCLELGLTSYIRPHIGKIFHSDLAGRLLSLGLPIHDLAFGVFLLLCQPCLSLDLSVRSSRGGF